MKRIGRYEIQADVGRGGFGQVFRAHDPTVGRTVAIKILLAAEDPELLLRFRSEAAAAGKLRHRNIVTIYDFGEEDHVPYLVMEYLEGEDLDRIIASQRPLPLLQKLDIMAQTAEGLHHAHVHGTFHRDIKPANIMILADGTVKIMDFGIALLSQGTVARITRQGSLVGTFPYMAPEQFYGAASDALTDLFAYGVTCYKLLTGVHPFQAPEMASMMFNIVNKTPAPIRSLVPECPEALEDAVSKMMAKERDSRYQTLEDVKFDLEPIIDELGRERIGDLIQQARTLIESGEFEQAQPLVREALEIDPGNRTARELRDRVQRLTKDRAIRPQITALIGAGRQQIQAQHYEQAIRKFESALQLDKSNREIQELIQQARAAWEQQQRADRLVGEARQALSAGELTAAHKGINDALSAFPDHSQAKALLAEVREKIEAREREARLHEGLVRVRGLVLLRSFEPALNELNQLRSEYPESADVERLLTKVTAERDAQVRRERLEARANEVKKLIRDQEFAKASDLASRSLRDFPESNSIADLGSYAADEERSQRRSALIAQVTAETSALMEAGEFDEAISRLRNALQEHPTASSLRERLQAVSSAKSERARKEALERTHAEAARLIANSAFAPALDCIAAFTAAYGEAAELDRVRRSAEEELEKQRRIAAIRKLLLDGHGLLDEGRPGTASQMLQQATIQYPDDSALTHLLGVARDQIREQQRNPEISNVISEAESLARSEKFDEALQLLDEALKKNPQETRLVHCKEGISAAKAAHEQKLIRTRITNQAKALRQGGQLEDALILLRSAAKFMPAESLAKDAEFQLLSQQIESELLEKHRENEVRQTVIRAEALVARGDLLSATGILHEAVKSNPSNVELTRLVGIADERKREQKERADRPRIREQELNLARESLQNLTVAGRFEEASEQARAALKKFGPEAELFRIEAESLVRNGRLEEAIAVLEKAPIHTAELQEVLNRARAALAEKRREELIRESLALCDQSRCEEALAVLQRAILQYGDSPEASELRRRLEGDLQEQQRREARDRDLASLLALEDQIGTITSRRKLRRTQQEANRWISAHSDDAQIVQIGSRIQARIESALAEKRGPNKLLLVGVAACVIAVAALLLRPRFLHRTLAFELVPQKAASELKGPPLKTAPGQTGSATPPTAPAPSPTVPAPTPAVPSPEALEAHDWQRAHSSGDPAQLRRFIARYPASSHMIDAQAEIDDLDWSRVDTSDVQSLKAYLSQHARGRHTREASQRIDDLDWLSVDKGDEDALQDYLDGHPNSKYSNQAESLIATMEANTPKGSGASTVQAESFEIHAALDQFNAAFQKGQPNDVRKIWPAVPAKYTEAMRASDSTFVMHLEPVAPAEVNGNMATISCDLLITTTLRGQSSQTHKPVKVKLQKVDSSWSILDALGL